VRIKRKTVRLLSVAAVGVSAVVMAAGPAAAATDDSFSVATTDSCGVANFVDYGTWPNGGADDDYIVIHDYCGDGHGVRVWLTWNASEFDITDTGYNGSGLAGAPVYWDPFKFYGNVVGGDVVTIKVCLVDGSGDKTGSYCRTATHTSVDG
jgi:hypothetical protein